MRPQRKRQLERRQLLSEIEVGDEIVSTGGLFAVVTEVAESEIHAEIAPGVTVRMARAAVAGFVERDESEGETAEETPESPSETPLP